MLDKLRNNQKGILLLLSLVMTSVILVAAVILATLAIREARLSTVSDRAITAFLGGEGSAEEVLYEINKQAIADPTTLTGSQTLANGVEVTRTVETSRDQFIYDFVPAGSSVVINLYNTQLANQAGNVSSVLAATKSAGDIDYALNQWDGATLTELETGTFTGSTNFSGLNPAMAYAIVLAPRGQDIIELTVTADNAVETPTTVLVIGELNGAEQAVELVLPKNAPWEGGYLLLRNVETVSLKLESSVMMGILLVVTDVVRHVRQKLYVEMERENQGSHVMMEIRLTEMGVVQPVRLN